MHDDPFTLVICLDKSGAAKGTLYIDDEKSYEYRQGKYVYAEFDFKQDVLSNKYVTFFSLLIFKLIKNYYRFIDSNEKYVSKTWLERVVIAGLTKSPKSASLRVNDGTAETLEVYRLGNTYVVRKPGVKMIDTWSITLHY